MGGMRMIDQNEEDYLTVTELSQKIKFARQTIYNLISKKIFEINKHFIKPRPKKILFKWAAVKAWMENTSDGQHEVPEIPLKASDPGEETPGKVVKVKLPESAIKI
jgi:predicted DNA-binding transcriptional regulator AlpA